ncbi:hypothetical protein [Dielma fastidiosa]|uniref:Uncharacterized protein n=1 Tax=Dielma fastidiosa TaxID=1034346 RepID=A0A318KT81_9FIRM|nr:hypothetical protein [Dielma fastidiosa]PXX80950.1 hypothetical protein DES51_10268 [Dielma fastidiosa]
MIKKAICCLVLLICFAFIGLKIFEKLSPNSQDNDQQIISDENKVDDQTDNEAHAENLNNYPQEINDVNNYFGIVETTQKQILDFETVDSEALLNDFVTLEWPADVYFSPLYLSDDGVVYGEADRSENRSALFLASYNCNTGEFKELKNMDGDSIYASFKILIVYENNLIFEEYNQANGIAYYYMYDLDTDMYKVIKQSENVPPHYNIADMDKNGLMFNWYDDLSTEDNKYIITYYSFAINEFEVVEEENSGHPVYHKNKWYYLREDKENMITQLIQYDMRTKAKTIIYETTGLENCMMGLYGDENNLILMMNNNSLTKVYEIDVEKDKIFYYFESEWIEAVNIKNGIMTWSGTKTIENRSRPQNYLLDLNTDIHYLFADSDLLLSNTGIAWIDLKKPDNEIAKGQLSINENSQLAYQKMN